MLRPTSSNRGEASLVAGDMFTDAGEGRFREGLRDARLARLLSGGQFAEDFATNYVGPSDTTR
jgi:hypothetical protein